MVASSLSDTDSEQEIIPNFFSVHPKLKNIPRVLSAFTSKYQWSKLALIVDQANSARTYLFDPTFPLLYPLRQGSNMSF